jgi:hypothetical protein
MHESTSLERRPGRDPLSPAQRREALLIALVADAVQLVLLPLFAEGWLTPLNDALDLVVGFLLIRRLGWHVAFLPTFVAELLPMVDVFPSWTLAVWFVVRARHAPSSPPPASP